MNLNLYNKYALVCGSTAGIGKATAVALAEEGAIVTLIARNEDKLKAVLAELPSHRNHSYIVADFSNPALLSDGVVHLLVNGQNAISDGVLSEGLFGQPIRRGACDQEEEQPS